MRPFAIGFALLFFVARPAAAQLQSEVVAGRLAAPVAFVQDPSLSDTQYVGQQFGRIRVVRGGQLQPTDLLDVSGSISAGGESGLLGLAFAPDYAASGRFFINFTNTNGDTVIARFLRSSGDPRQADASTRFDLQWPGGERFIVQPFANHNGGDLHFGSDGYLYIAPGDGGSGNDPGHRRPDVGAILGAQFTPSGYTLTISSPLAGMFDLVVFAQSSVTGTFDQARVVRVTIAE